MEPLVTILVPTYEPNPVFLKAAIESVLAQTETRWHILIHDDASACDVRSMVHEYLSDPRIRFERTEKRLGIGGNWNACLRMTKETSNTYVQFLFQDDVWKPTYLEHSLQILESQPTVGLVFSHHSYVFEGQNLMQEHYAHVEEKRRTIPNGVHEGSAFLQAWIEQELQPNLIGEPSFVMLRRTVIDTVGDFDESMPQCLDSDYWLRCLQVTDCAHIATNLGNFRVHASGASAQNQESGAGIFDRFRTFQKLITALPNGPTRQATILARNRALKHMSRSLLHRLRTGKKVKGKGSGELKKFVLRHPFLMTKVMLQAMRAR